MVVLEFFDLVVDLDRVVYEFYEFCRYGLGNVDFLDFLFESSFKDRDSDFIVLSENYNDPAKPSGIVGNRVGLS